MWTLDEAIDYIREHQPKFREIEYHLALGGSVLQYGKSDNDLDIIVMNMSTKQIRGDNDLDNLLFALNSKFQPTPEEYEGKSVYRKYATTFQGKKIDWFVYPE